MKHTFASIILLLFVALMGTEAQNGPHIKLKWSYRMSEFGKTYLVGGEDLGGPFNLYICAETMFPGMSDEIGILVEYKDLNRFKRYLRQVRAKYAQWTRIASQHAVKNYYKDLAFNYTGTCFYRHNSTYYKVTNNKLDAWFSVDPKGKSQLKITTEKYIADGRRSGGRFKMVFSSLGEIDALIKIVNESGARIEEKREKTNGLDALFQ